MSEQGSSNLYSSTSSIAGQQAAGKSGSWRFRILLRLRDTGGATLFEVADHYGVPDHTISGRFSELERDLVIEHAGERRNHPVSGCPAEVWRIRGAINQKQPDVPALLGYPTTLTIDGELYDRQQLLPKESYPGVPYARRADSGGQQAIVRIELVECPGCGKTLKFVQEDGRKKLRCGTPSCNSTWEGAFVTEPGKTAVLALVARTF